MTAHETGGCAPPAASASAADAVRARPALDGDGWVAITSLAEHRMDRLQAQIWNAAVTAAERALATAPAGDAVTRLDDFLREEGERPAGVVLQELRERLAALPSRTVAVGVSAGLIVAIVDSLLALAAAPAPAGREAVEMSPEFTDTARAALAWVLWHHQGGSSPIGQAIRFALGMGQHERMSDEQVAEAKRWSSLSASSSEGER